MVHICKNLMAFLQKENSCSFRKIFYVGKTLYNGAYLRREKAVLSNVGNKGNDFQSTRRYDANPNEET